MRFTILVNDQGRVHYYLCEQRVDAELLFKAMCVYISGTVSMWQGGTRIAIN